jgi:RibD C-terminal domain
MRRVVAAEYVTVDGVMQDPGGVGEIEEGGWSNPSFREGSGEVPSGSALRERRATARARDLRGLCGCLALDGGVGGGVRRPDEQASKARRIDNLAGAPLEWNATLIEGDLAEAVSGLKQQNGQDILIYGSSQLFNTLAQSNLIDEYRLMVFPVALGRGKPLFMDAGSKLDLRLRSSQTSASGVVMLTYEPA